MPTKHNTVVFLPSPFSHDLIAALAALWKTPRKKFFNAMLNTEFNTHQTSLQSQDFSQPVNLPDGRQYRLEIRLMLQMHGVLVEVEATRLDRPAELMHDPDFADQRWFDLKFRGVGDVDAGAARILLEFSCRHIARHLRANAQPTSRSRIHTIFEIDLNADPPTPCPV